MAGRRIELERMTFNRLTVIKHIGHLNKRTTYLCKCSCGNEKEIRADMLKTGKIKSCGCLNKEVSRARTGDKSPIWKGNVKSKICPICKIEKDSSEFNKCNKQLKSGETVIRLVAFCISCANTRTRNKYKEDPKKYIYYVSRRTKNHEPKWLVNNRSLRDSINSIYSRCAELNKIDGPNSWHVDHIYPINGTNSCGLHVPWNLRIISRLDNLRKSNKS